MNHLLRVIDSLCIAAENAAILILYSIAILMLSETIARSFFNLSIPFSWEYSAYGMAAAFFLGSGNALRVGAHIRVMFMQSVLPRRYAKALDLVATAGGTLLTVIITASLFALVQRSMSRDMVSNTVMQTPLAVPQMVLLLGAFLLLLAFVARLLRLLTGREAELGLPNDEAPDPLC